MNSRRRTNGFFNTCDRTTLQQGLKILGAKASQPYPFCKQDLESFLESIRQYSASKLCRRLDATLTLISVWITLPNLELSLEALEALYLRLVVDLFHHYLATTAAIFFLGQGRPSSNLTIMALFLHADAAAADCSNAVIEEKRKWIYAK